MAALTTISSFSSPLPTGRRRSLALGKHYAAAADAIRARGIDAALELVATMGGVTQPRGLARSLVKAIERNPEFGRRAHRVAAGRRFDGTPERILFVPHIGWRFQGARQVAVIEEWPMHVVAPLPRRKLP